MVKEHVGKLVGAESADSIGEEIALTDLGVDSEMAVELQVALDAAFDDELSLPATLAFDYPTVLAISRFILEKQKLTNTEKPVADSAGDDKSQDDHSLQDVDELSDAEIEKRLLEKLTSNDEE